MPLNIDNCRTQLERLATDSREREQTARDSGVTRVWDYGRLRARSRCLLLDLQGDLRRAHEAAARAGDREGRRAPLRLSAGEHDVNVTARLRELR